MIAICKLKINLAHVACEILTYTANCGVVTVESAIIYIYIFKLREIKQVNVDKNHKQILNKR